MKIIGIETSSIQGGVAALEVVAGDIVKWKVKEITIHKGLIHGRLLVPALDRLLNKVKWRKDKIDLVAVDIGPGSYTGLRVGLAIAKTLSFLLNTKIVGVSSLDALLANPPAGDYDFLCPVIDAKWHQVYTAIYKRVKRRDERGEETTEYRRSTDYLAISPEELVRYISKAKGRPSPFQSSGYGTTDGKILLFGDGIKSYYEVFKDLTCPAGKNISLSDSEDRWFPKAKNVAILGYKYYKEGRSDEPIRLLPMYLRETEAEIILRNRKA